MNKLIMFHGRECPHCIRMMQIVLQLEKDTDIKFEKLEVWHDEKNADKMRAYREIIEPACGGQLRTPTFLNTETEAVMCGEVRYDELKNWATEKEE